MPYAKRKRKNPRRKARRNYYRRKKNYNQITNISRSPIAKRALLKLRYYEDIILPQPVVGAASNYFFRCNSLFDPNYTGIGHQPLGYDEFSQFYNHYTVLSAKATVKFTPDWSSTGVDNCRFAIAVSPDTTAVVDNEKLFSQPSTKWKHCSTQKDMTTISKTFSTKNYFGLSKGNIVGNDKFQASINANPNEQAFFRLSCSPIHGSVQAPAAYASIMIEYLIVMSEPKVLNLS